eukprot:CAMPEP_0173431652 /NCGR_PEP_ID=MMETSP1357-20121228/9727_1 /TAXON_ID=77926 /ORGANISM="Hemiselmis rufescens, Strain PCC563" /LENGTH=391 /DNA_ID=CAMNT_0014396155 /DNA_START=66 /DNA_END=1241 /DNA_ORIENTATION=-
MPGFFSDVPASPPDPLLSIDGRFRSDTRASKLNLGIGVLRRVDASPHEFATVLKAAKGVPVSTFYPSPAGDQTFLKLSSELVLGEVNPRVMAVQTVGGSGALRVCAELLVSQGITDMMLPNPSWANHKPLLTGGGCRISEYKYLDEDTHTVDIEGMIGALEGAPKGTAIMLQVAAHNPTGVDLTGEQWERVLGVFKRREGEIFPVFDSAYQGLAKGLEEDVAVVRRFLKEGMEFIVCNSHSKNFGLYGERVGSCFVACESAEVAANVSSRCQLRIRWNYSVPPLFGARIVASILGDPSLRKDWEAELAAARDQLNAAHGALAGAIRGAGLPGKLSSPKLGLFSQLFLTDAQVGRLEKDHGIYVGPGGRLNVSSLTEEAAKQVAAAVCDVLK